jgi:phosphate-selective porin OprO/OprP
LGLHYLQIMKKLFTIILISLLCAPGLVNAQGCAAPSSEEGVTLWGYLQPEFNYTNIGADANGATPPNAQFNFRRMRIGLMGNIPYDFGYYVLVETSQFLNPNETGPFLLDAFVSYNRFQYAKVAVGSFKIPFGRELSMPCHGLYTINRSFMVDELAANLEGFNRDLGLMLLGGSDTTLFTYRAAITNGYGIFNRTDNNLLDAYSLTGRVTVQPIPGLYFGGSVKYTSSPPSSDGVEEDDTKMRYGFDAQYSFKKFTVVGEYIHGDDEGSYTEGGGCGGDAVTKTGTNVADGWYVMLIYRTNSNFEPVYKLESYDTKKSDGGDIPTINETTSMCQTFGLNYYPNDWTRLQVNYIYRAETPDEINNDKFLLQLQVRF